jgi:hypothetical protein
MKQSRTVIPAILAVVVLLTTLGLSSCSKKKGQNSPTAESKTGTEIAESKTGTETAKIIQAQKSTTEEIIQALKSGDANELEIARAKRVHVPRPERRVVRPREIEREKLINLSPEERAKLKEQREKIQQKWQNMSEEEKEKFAAQMRGAEMINAR